MNGVYVGVCAGCKMDRAVCGGFVLICFICLLVCFLCIGPLCCFIILHVILSIIIIISTRQRYCFSYQHHLRSLLPTLPSSLLYHYHRCITTNHNHPHSPSHLFNPSSKPTKKPHPHKRKSVESLPRPSLHLHSLWQSGALFAVFYTYCANKNGGLYHLWRAGCCIYMGKEIRL